eukprot:SAG31_NODE_36517_length_312_cov_1.417840_1_plen_59_part_01
MLLDIAIAIEIDIAIAFEIGRERKSLSLLPGAVVGRVLLPRARRLSGRLQPCRATKTLS